MKNYRRLLKALEDEDIFEIFLNLPEDKNELARHIPSLLSAFGSLEEQHAAMGRMNAGYKKGARTMHRRGRLMVDGEELEFPCSVSVGAFVKLFMCTRFGSHKGKARYYHTRTITHMDDGSVEFRGGWGAMYCSSIEFVDYKYLVRGDLFIFTSDMVYLSRERGVWTERLD